MLIRQLWLQGGHSNH